MQCSSRLATYNCVFASVTSDSQQLLLTSIGTTAKGLTEEECSVILSKKDSTVINVLMLLILVFQVTT